MIIIVEGINGSGKTTLAKSIGKELGLPIFRPFRRDGLIFCNTVEMMRKLDIPVNTYIEDIFVAEAVGQLSLGVVLDRALPSAIAYGLLYGDVNSYLSAKPWIDIWQESLLQAGPVVYLYLGCTYEDSHKRCHHEKFPLEDKIEWWRVASWLDATYSMVDKVPKLSIDTTCYGVEAVFDIAMRFVDGHKGPNKAPTSKGS